MSSAATTPSALTYDAALSEAGIGPFQKRLFATFALVWAADAMQVLAIGFTAAGIAATFRVSVPEALQTGTSFFAGMLIGAFVFGRLADRYGRRAVLIATVLIDAAFGIASAFAPDLAWLLALRFLTGLGVGGTLPIDYTMMAEFLPANRRGRWLVAMEGFWAVGTLVVALVAVVAPALAPDAPWRAIFAITGIPALIGLVIRFWIPESPLFLLSQGRTEAAKAVVADVARINGRTPPSAELRPAKVTKRPLSDLLAPAFRRRTVLLLLAWLLVSAAYYGVFVWLPIRFAAQGFTFIRGNLFLVLVALAQIPGYALAAYGVEVWGRRPTLIGFLILSAAGCLLYGFGASAGLIAAATLLMSFALLGTWGALYAFTPEVYPTDLRATGMGTAGAMARLGGLLAPSVMAPIMATSFTAALVLFSILLLIAAVAAFGIDIETRKRALD
ncbi:MFS transporter [Jiella sp. M17.18]|uniref:MFS transporter n=1 Tax=Jiella sp. M17.18 TaxID=3234247 RepID=UPI0034DE9015